MSIRINAFNGRVCNNPPQAIGILRVNGKKLKNTHLIPSLFLLFFTFAWIKESRGARAHSRFACTIRCKLLFRSATLLPDSRHVHRGGGNPPNNPDGRLMLFLALGEQHYDYEQTGPVVLPPWAKCMATCAVCSKPPSSHCISCDSPLCDDHADRQCPGCSNMCTQPAIPAAEGHLPSSTTVFFPTGNTTLYVVVGAPLAGVNCAAGPEVERCPLEEMVHGDKLLKPEVHAVLRVDPGQVVAIYQGLRCATQNSHQLPIWTDDRIRLYCMCVSFS